MLAMRLGDVSCASDGWVAQGNRVIGEFAFDGVLTDGQVFVAQIECQLARTGAGLLPGFGGKLTPIWFINLIPGFRDVHELTGRAASVVSMAAVGPFQLRASLRADGMLVANPYEPAAARALLDLLRTGENCVLQLVCEYPKLALSLPLPVGEQFETAVQEVICHY